ncbi:Nicotinate-nucleotide--dimethylbenzimidazole phosphoribosyltransferase [Streptomyces sp. enrichment culture]|uniref:nicotinate-nucleotide--dimethylbenzimidazole phosphoribosyltransferase n=1 Tax=Streptomyces sp. enrichment culture TaxID=1795815 RepID=UPI003F57A44E
MTDTGQVPGEGLPENAGMVEQPGVAAPGAYTYLSETPAEDEDLLLPGAQGAWGNEVAPPAPEPVVEAVHEPGPHELAGRDSGSVDLTGVRLPNPTLPTAPTTPIPPITPRRPLHLGPQIPDASASPVRSLADRGPEYLDVPRDLPPQGAAPWGAQAPVQTQAPAAPAPAPAPVQAPVAAEPTPAETVVPPVAAQPEPADAAQAAVARLTSQATASAMPGAVEAEQVPEAAQAAADTANAAEVADVPVGPAVEEAADASGSGEFPVAAAVEAEAAAQAPVAAAVEAEAAAQAPVEAAAAAAVPEVVEFPAAAGEDASTGQVPVEAVAEAGQEPAEVVAEAAAEVEAAPEVAAEDGQVAAAVAPADADPVTPVQLPDATPVPAPDAGQVADVPAEPQAVPAPDAVEPQQPEALQGPVAVQVPEPDAEQVQPVAAPEPAPETPQAPEPIAAVATEAPEQAAPETPQAPEAVVSEAPQAPAVLPEAAEVPEAPEVAEAVAVAAAQAPEAPAPVVEAPVPAEAPQVVEPDQQAETLPQPQPADTPQQPQPPVDQPVDQLVAPPAPEPAPEPEAAVADVPSAVPADDVQIDAAPEAPAEIPAPEAPAGIPAPEVSADAPAPLAAEPGAEQAVGQFVPVEGSIPTTPNLAPTVPAPREPEQAAAAEDTDEVALVQQADDLDTRAAEQEDLRDLRAEQADEAHPTHQTQQADQQEEGTAPVADARQSTGPAAPAYTDVEREAVLKVMRERRDIRNGFRSDPIPHEVLLRVLEAAHTAPSVGHSQPWDFVVIRSADTRRAMHELAMLQREAYAKSLPKGRAKQFKELKIEAILDTPVNIVVTADPTRGGRHTLGRHTQPQMAPYSAALAVENLWLAARAEGLGVGWVSFFDEREMVRALGLPEHLEVIAYLCVGYVDEFPDEPELMQAGWSKRRPLSWVVHEETYGRRALPGEEPHDLLAETVAQIRPLDAKALGEAWERQKRMTKPAGALGMLEIISAQLSGLSRQCPPPIPEPAAVAIFAGDHGVHAQGVTPWPQEVTAQMVANFLGGGAVCNAFAGQVGAEVCIIDVGVAADLPSTPGLLPRKVRPGTADMTTGPAMTREEAKKAIEVGIETARDLVAAGNKALLTGEMGIANTTASAALISVFTGADPAEVTGRGTGINDETLARKTEVVRRAIEVHQPDPADPIGVLAAIGGLEHAAMVGLLLGGASLRTPVILDGVSAGAAALVARAIAPEVLAACIAGHRSAEPGHVAALNKLGLRPLVDLDLRLGEGTGALLALPMVQSTARAMHEVATFDSAGVTEK